MVGSLADWGTTGTAVLALVLNTAGVDPAPRRAGPTWAQFLQAQAKAILGCDLFHLDTITLHRSTRSSSSSMPAVECTCSASPPIRPGTWLTQLARNLPMDLDDRAVEELRAGAVAFVG